jgi:putative ABC transport system permease protein
VNWRLLRTLRTLVRHRRIDDDVRREAEFHLALERERRERAGMSADEARRTALRDFGGVERTREEVRDVRGITFWDALVRDVRFGARLLARRPGFTAVAVVVLALGIGANTTVFSLVNALLLKPRVGHPDGALVSVYSRDRTQPDLDSGYRAFSYPNYVDLRAHIDVFASLAAHMFALGGLTEGNSTRRVFVDIVTANYFATFGVAPRIGRTFTAEEERPGAGIASAILSYPAWQRMGGSADAIGQTVRLNGRDFTIVGVAPEGFGGSFVLITPELWVPTGMYDAIANDFVKEDRTTTLADRRHDNLVLVARLHPGATIASVSPALDLVAAEAERAHPDVNAHQVLSLAPLSRLLVSTSPGHDSGIGVVAMALLSMSGLVLIIASFNLANMSLARAGARSKEFAIRLAIGGSRSRLFRQILTESLLLSFIGGAAGLVVAFWSGRLLLAMLAPVSPVILSFDSAPDIRVVLATFGFCALSALVVGLLPAWRLLRGPALPYLKEHAGDVPARRRSRFALNNGLVTVQLAVSLAVLTVAGLFVRGSVLAAGADPGFSFTRGVMIQVDSSLAGYDEARGGAVDHQILDRLRARPDVTAASLSSTTPFGDITDGRLVQRAGAPITPGDATTSAGLVDSIYTSIGSEYFRTLGLAMRRGREFTSAEEAPGAAAAVAIIDEPLARRLFGQNDPIGRSVQYAAQDKGKPPIVLQVVGVAPGLRQDLFDAAPEPHLYVPFGFEYRSNVYFQVATGLPSAGAEVAALPGFRRTVAAVDPRVPILSIETRSMFRDHNVMLAVVRMGAAIFGAFGAVALFLSAVGVYGVKAYVVSRRTRELGIRTALGATPGRVIWDVVREGMVTSVAGLGAGLGLAALSGAAMRSLVYQARGFDPLVLGSALLVLVAATLGASWLPARRAARVAPLGALRG